MSNLVLSDVQVSAVKERGLRYKNSQRAYIAEDVVPVVSVPQARGTYPIIARSDWYRDEVQNLALGSRWPELSFSLDLTSEYECHRYLTSFRVPLEIRGNADKSLGLMKRAAELVTDKLALARERRVAELMFTASNWDNSDTPGDLWDTGSGDPLGDIRTAIQTVESGGGIRPNTIIVGAAVGDCLHYHGDVTPLWAGNDLPLEKALARYFDVDRFAIGRAKYTTDAEGTAEADVTYSNVWGKHCWVGYQARGTFDNPETMEPSGAMIFRNELSQRLYYIDATDTVKVAGLEVSDERATDSALGYLLESVIS